MTSLAPRTVELAQTLLQSGLTIGIAESLTGGLVAGEIARVPGISAALVGAVVAYQTPVKHHVLGVSRDVLRCHGAVSAECAIAMAAGVRRTLTIDGVAPDLGLSTTGVAGPEGQEGRPAGTVFVGIDSVFGHVSVALDFRDLVNVADPVGTRERVRQATVEAAIFHATAFLATR